MWSHVSPKQTARGLSAVMSLVWLLVFVLNVLLEQQELFGYNDIIFSMIYICLWAVCLLAFRDPMAMERANLLNMAKLSIKGLIESALSFGRTLDSDYPPLQQFFVVMEHCLKHGLKGMFSYHQTASHKEPSVNQLSFKVLTCLLFGRIAAWFSVINISYMFP